MPCNVEDYNIVPADTNEPSIPGFGPPSVPSANIPGLPTPNGFPESLTDILDNLSLILPSGTFKPNLNPNIDRTLIDGIVKLLDYLTPFLAMYKMVLPVLNMIICIIEVLCALMNPFKLARAIKRLFRRCIPDFLALFPIFAMVLLIISLLLLIIALLEYIITEIARVVNQIIKNLALLSRIAKRQDQRSALTAMRKIGSLLCFLKNLFAVLQIVALVIQLIKDIIKLFFRIPPCDDSDTSDDGCCTPEVCPAFIKRGEFSNSTGKLQYLNQIGLDASGIAGLPPAFGPIFANLGALRQESWQFYDETLKGTNAFYNITEPVDVDPKLGFTFFPTGKTYTAKSSIYKVPYTVDLRLFYNPADFGVVDPLGARLVQIKDCIVTITPNQHLINWANAEVMPDNGVLNLTGGKVTENDGSTPIFINGKQATLTTLIHLTQTIGVAAFDNTKLFQNVDYIFKINHSVLVGEQLISLGCMPDVAFDRNFVNGNVGAGLGVNADKLANLPIPDPQGTIDCVNAAMTKLSQNVTVDAVALFQAETTACLRNLGNDLSDLLDDLVDLGFCSYKSTFTVNPSIQFTTKPIIVTAKLNDIQGNNLCSSLPSGPANDIAVKLVPEITFGTISKFTYDGVSAFTAELNSELEGMGEIRLMYDNTFFSELTIPDNLSETPNTKEQVLTYQFIKTSVGTGLGGTDSDGKPRRDEGDVSRSE